MMIKNILSLVLIGLTALTAYPVGAADSGRVERNPDRAAISRGAGSAPEATETDPRKAVEGRIMSRAWQRYEAKSYDQAEKMFRRVAENPQSSFRNEARLGLAFTLIKTGRTDQAASVLTELVRAGYQLDKTVPDLMNLLIEAGQLDRARAIAADLSRRHRAGWLARIDQIETKARYQPQEKALAKGWRAFKQADYLRAEELFNFAASAKQAPFRNEARLGLAYSLVKRERPDEAAPIFRELIAADYKLDQTTHALLHILAATKRPDQARPYLAKLNKADRAAWDKRLTGLEFELALDRLTSPAEADELIRLIDRRRPDLAGCLFTDQFRRAAGLLGKWDRADQAANLYQGLLACLPGTDWIKRIELFKDAAAWLPAEAALDLIRREEEKPASSRSEYAAGLTALELGAVKKRLTELKPTDPAFGPLADRAIGLDPADLGLRSRLAWACYNNKNYRCAEHHFRLLNQKNPADKNSAEGLAYTLIELGRDEEALEVIDRYEKATRDQKSGLKRDALIRLGQKAFDAKQYPVATGYLDRADRLAPLDPSPAELLAWSRFHNRDYASAGQTFTRLFEAEPTPGRADHVLLALNKSGDETGRERFLDRLAASEDPRLQGVAGQAFFFDQRYLTAARTDRAPDRVYRNWDAPRLDAGGYYLSRSGDDGLTRLDQLVLPGRFSLPLFRGAELTLSYQARRLDAGSGPETPYAGRYYRYINNPAARTDRLIETRWVHLPRLDLLIEGPVDFRLAASTTPLNGPTDPMVAFELSAEKRNDWSIEAHQRSIEETMLSYVGQRDPYSGQTWGRVVRSGGSIRKSFSLGGSWWSSLELGYDYYWGLNTLDNQAGSATLGLGRSDEFSVGRLTSGVLVVSKFFQRNTNFQTYGHGGYFSPQEFVLTGPFLSWQSKPGRRSWLELQATGGYLYHRTDSADHYPLDDADGVDPTLPGAGDLAGRYPGETTNSFGFDLRLRALQLLGDHLTVGLFGGLNNTSDFTQAYGGALISLSFQPIKAVHPGDRLFAPLEAIHR